MSGNPPRAPGELADLIEHEREYAKSLGFQRSTLWLSYEEATLIAAALRASHSDGAAASEWRPIETAPKDGKPFLATHHSSGVQQITWFGKTSHVPLYGWAHGEDVEDIDLWQPTHWMPLPAPPALAQPDRLHEPATGGETA